MKVLDLIRKEKIPYTEVVKIYNKKKSSIHEIVKKKRKKFVNFAIVPHFAKDITL